MNKRNHLIIDGKSTAVFVAKLDDKSEIVFGKVEDAMEKFKQPQIIQIKSLFLQSVSLNDINRKLKLWIIQ
jgi:hypothetical protein